MLYIVLNKIFINGEKFMRISEARSYSQGIEFLVRCEKGSIIVRGKRDLGGNVVVELDNNFTKERFVSRFKMSIIIATFSLIMAWLGSIIKDHINVHVIGLEILTILWFTVILYALFMKGQKSREEIYRYHGAEHKVLNYIEKYNKIPKTIEELRKADRLYISCGMTILAVIMLVITMAFLAFSFVPYLVLKVFVFLISLVLIFYLWANGKCDFLQRCIVLEPTDCELEVAIEAMKVYEKL